ncbi:MAG: cell division protein ZapE [Actinomycetes bacterium]
MPAEREPHGAVVRLVDRHPALDRDRLLADLVPPPRFASVSFESYHPDPNQPSQAVAVERLRRFAASVAETSDTSSGWRRLLGRGGSNRGPSCEPAGVYLDGGFGVGKTHLLASLWRAVPGPKAFGTFVEFTNLVGALGFRDAVEALSASRLVCIDEFELDDPGDTVLMARLLRELVDGGTRLAATSNTLPEALGEGRFAAEDFLREIQAVASHFEVVRIDGEDYRHRGLPDPPEPLPDDALVTAALHRPGTALDEFDDLVRHLATVHPSRYGSLLDGVTGVAWRGVETVRDQAVALRLVVLADRIYDRDVPLLVGGDGLADLFPPEMLAGGYRKKYRRALSRLTALAREGRDALRS